MNNEIEKLKLKICEKCRKSIQKNFVDCPFQSFDNEYCGDLEQIIECYIKSKEKESVIAELEQLKDEFGKPSFEIYSVFWINRIIDQRIKEIKIKNKKSKV